MSTMHHDSATTWRDLENELTFDQVGQLLSFESKAKGDPASVAEVLLKDAREHVRQNKIDDENFGHLPTPAGAEHVYHWEDDGEGHWSRQFLGVSAVVKRPSPQYPNHRNSVEIGIDGIQHQDGTIERTVHIYSGGTSFTATEVRELVTHLARMAEEIDRDNG
ncbi:hypothetical protein GAN17_09440 [Mycobacterium kubicae]|uniref:hypothetical protein n=1 Tax=Mycobacterium kubicae TaxID=120959 RepID=UPI001640B152|nr:hypothetical protein [Mycobacterium kubicae]QNI06495.1 hypothetical protein GAN17_09440 [Mycobacterium kubicae]